MQFFIEKGDSFLSNEMLTFPKMTAMPNSQDTPWHTLDRAVVASLGALTTY